MVGKTLVRNHMAMRLTGLQFIEHRIHMIIPHLVFKCGKGISCLGKL